MRIQDLKIALIGPLPPPSGGMANQTRQLAELLGLEGVSVELVQVNAPYRPRWVGHIKGLRAAFRMLPYLIHLWRAAGKADLFHVMANSGWSWHLYATPAIWIANLKKIPVVVNYHGGEAGDFLARALRWVKPGLARTDELVVPSGFLKEVFGRFGFAATVVPNVINLSRFSPKLPSPDNASELHILVARNLEPIYDNTSALRAFRIVKDQLPNARLTIAGSGPERAALEDLARILNIDAAVHFTGRVDNECMPELYRSADVMINASLADNMPVSILEALASGVPIVSTDVGGVPFLVENGRTALLVPPGDPQAMAQALIQVLTTPDLARRLSEAGLASVQQYTWQCVRERLFGVYGQLCTIETAQTVVEST